MDDLKNIFDRIEQAQSILKNLDAKRADKTIEQIPSELSKEHQATINNARKSLIAIKDRLSKELAVKTLELDQCQEQLAVLQTRMKVGEISEETFTSKSKHLIEKIQLLEKKVIDTQELIKARFAEEHTITPEPEGEGAATNPAPEEAVAVTQSDTQIPVRELPPSKQSVQRLPDAASDIQSDLNAIPVQEFTEEKAEDIPQQTTDISEAKKEIEELEAEKAVQLVQDIIEELNRKEAEETTVAGINRVTMNDTNRGTDKKSQGDKAGETRIVDDSKSDNFKNHKPTLHLHRLEDNKSYTPRAPLLEKMEKNRFLAVVIAAFILALLTWGSIALFMPKTGASVGDVAPNIVMQLGNDNVTSLSSLRGKNVVIVFWDRDFWDSQFFYVNGVAHHLYTPSLLNQLYSKYSSNELAIIAIASGTNNNEIDKLIQDYDVQFPVIVDSFGKLSDSYKIHYEPTYIFLDKNGIIRARIEGPILNMTDLEQMVYSASQKGDVKAIPPPVTDVIIQSVTEKSATINWTTQQPTTTQLDIDGKNIQTVITSSPQTLHSMTLKELSPATSYKLRIVYNINNINVSEHSFSAIADTIVSKRYVVTTTTNDLSNPEISNISTSFITDSSVTITWKTDEPTIGFVDFSTDTKYSDSAPQGNALSIWHTVKVEGLKPDTQYNLRLRSRDASGKIALQEIEPIKTQTLIEVAAKIGKRAPDFSLYTLDGTKVTLSQFLGRKVLLNFWLEGCPACESEMPIIQTIYNKYSRDQLIILAVNVRGAPDKVGYYVAREKLTFPVLMDTLGDADDMYRAPFFPASYFIDSKGVIREIIEERFQTVGQVDDILNKLD